MTAAPAAMPASPVTMTAMQTAMTGTPATMTASTDTMMATLAVTTTFPATIPATDSFNEVAEPCGQPSKGNARLSSRHSIKDTSDHVSMMEVPATMPTAPAAMAAT